MVNKIHHVSKYELGNTRDLPSLKWDSCEIESRIRTN